MDFILKNKIRLGISACNFGAKVRWNNAGWDRVSYIGRQKMDYSWTPICPEINSGLGVPRPPMKLVSGNGDNFWQKKAAIRNRKGANVTVQVSKGALASLEILKRADVDGYVFMEGSPSCGVYRTTLKNTRLGKPPGVFGSLVLKEDLFLIPAIDLESPWKWWDWSRRLHAFVWLKRLELATKKDLYDAWHVLKFMCQEVSIDDATKIGQTLANAPKKITANFIQDWKRSVLMLIRKPSTLKRIHAITIKHYAHYRKHFSKSKTQEQAPDIRSSKTIFIEKLNKFERKAFAEGYTFSGRPIIYKPDR